MTTITTLPREPTNRLSMLELDKTPIQPLQAPAPTGTEGVFKLSDEKASLSAQLAEFMGRNDLAVSEISHTAQFTKDDLERKNQEAFKAWNTGPALPIGGGTSGMGANTLQPFVNAFFNRERLNSGTPVRTELGAPYQRGIGNAWGDAVNASNWSRMARAQTESANIDLAGFAQVNHTGQFIPDRDTTYQPERGGLNGGPMSQINYGGANAGAVYSKQDGSAGGAVGFALLDAGAGKSPFSFGAVSGAGALAVPQAYGLSAFLSE